MDDKIYSNNLFRFLSYSVLIAFSQTYTKNYDRGLIALRISTLTMLTIFTAIIRLPLTLPELCQNDIALQGGIPFELFLILQLKRNSNMIKHCGKRNKVQV